MSVYLFMLLSNSLSEAHSFLDEVDTIEDVDIEDDVDNELEFE